MEGRANIHQPLGMWKPLLSGVSTHNSWIQHLSRMVTAKLAPTSTVLDQGQGQVNWKPAAPVCPLSLADWKKPIFLDFWPGYIICFQQNPMGKSCTNPKGVISIRTIKIIHLFLWSFSMEIHKNRLTGGHRALPELMDYQERRKHPVAVRSADLEETNWRKWPDFFFFLNTWL